MTSSDWAEEVNENGLCHWISIIKVNILLQERNYGSLMQVPLYQGQWVTTLHGRSLTLFQGTFGQNGWTLSDLYADYGQNLYRHAEKGDRAAIAQLLGRPACYVLDSNHYLSTLNLMSQKRHGHLMTILIFYDCL